MARHYPVFTNNALKRMEKWSLVEESVLDVWFNGENSSLPDGTPTMIRKYSDYEIGLSYSRDAKSGEYIIISVWQRDRR